jgi:hypothetical protein
MPSTCQHNRKPPASGGQECYGISAMAKRPIQHKISDQGVAEVSRILTNAGWACDSVKSDYGEDLVCQTSHQESVDPFRILVQVKSTQKKLGRSGISISIKKESLIKWLSDANLVIIVLWSVKDKTAMYLVPHDEFGLYNVDLSSQEQFSVVFSPHKILTQESADNLAWRSRFRNINRHFLETKSHLDYLTLDIASSKDETKKKREVIQKNIFSIITKFLIYIGLIKEAHNRITLDTRSFIYELMHLGAAAGNKPDLKDLKLDFNQIIFMVILLRASRTVPNIGFPAPLLEEAVHYYSDYIFQGVKVDPAWKNPPSRRKFETLIISLAKRLWMFGSKFSAEQIAGLIVADDLSFLHQEQA